MRPCFAFSAKTASKPTVLAIDDEIGFWGTQAKDFRDQLANVAGDIDVELNTPGGDVFAGLGIFNMLRAHAAKGFQVTTRVMGVAASIGSVLLLAGDKREMPKNTMAMTHNVASGIWGTADELRDHADTMDKVKGQLRGIYVDRLGVDEATADAMLGKDNWMTADEALAAGFATDLLAEVQMQAKFDVERASMPENVAKLFAAKTNEPEPEPELSPADKETLATPVAEAIVALATAGGLEAHAPFLALSCTSVDEAKTRIATAREITALCKVGNLEAKAARFIRDNKSVADVRAALIEDLADTDTQVDNAPATPKTGTTNGGPAKPAVVNTNTLWASHNAQSKKGR